MAKTSQPKAAQARRPAQADIAAQSATHLLVRARKAGFRRAGRAWSTDETTVAVDDFTPEQILDLLAEPMLIVLPAVTSDASASAPAGE